MNGFRTRTGGRRGRRFAAFALALGMAAPLGAASAPSSPQAAALAANVDRHYNALHSLQVNFVQQYDGMGMHREESGTLLLKKPGRMRWTYAKPAGKLFVLDGHDAYFYAPGQSEAQKTPAKKLDDLRSPLRFLLGHSQLAKELENLQAAPAGADFVLSGTPRGMENRIAALRLTVTATGAIERLEMEETDGATTRFLFSSEQPNVPAADGDFVFHAPNGVTVVTGLPPV